MEAFGTYLLHEMIASGGLGEVYRARRRGAAGFQKTVALKRIRPELAGNAELVQMIIDEAKLAARLAHGNIAQIQDLVEFHGEWAVVMEFVEGVDLFRLARALERHERRLGVEECIHVTKEILLALDYVHRLSDEHSRPLGLVHCDVAPANIMISRWGEVKLIDFGMTRGPTLAGMAGRARGGKMRYRAPEQVRGEPLDPKSDIYSVGIVFWEMLAGQRIYDSMSLEEILDAVASGDVPDIEPLRPEVPEHLVRVLGRAVHAEPRYRYPNAAAFLRSLEDLELVRDPARSRALLAEIVTAVLIEDRARSASTSRSPIALAEDRSLEDSLDAELE